MFEDKNSTARGNFTFRGFRAEFQNFAGLTVKRLANGFQRGETDGLSLSGLEDGKILRGDVHGFGQFVEPHFPLREDHVEINDDGHKLKRSMPVPLEVPALPSIATPQK